MLVGVGFRVVVPDMMGYGGTVSATLDFSFGVRDTLVLFTTVWRLQC